MKVALLHYWLVGMRGGEKVLEALCELYPDADIYTHVVDRENISDALKRHRIFTTFIQKLPRAKKWYQKYLPFMPMAMEQLDLTEYDLVISSESGPIKGVVTRPDAVHICYCHSPMRYVWDMYPDYLRSTGRITRFFMRPMIHYLKMWDYLSAARVDHFVANSQFVASRIRKFYRREAEVIHPPVAVEDFTHVEQQGDYYLLLGQLVGYKRADLAVKAFNQIDTPLVIIGEGEQFDELNRIAKPHIKILGRQPFSEIQHHYAHCRALIFPGVEDFGIVPLEAMASGRPVIAYGKGGALETVKDGVTGVYFHEQTETALLDAVRYFEAHQNQFDRHSIREWAEGFAKARFKEEMQTFIQGKIQGV